MSQTARLWGEAIKRQRLLLGMTQKDLGAAVGVEQAAVSLWERGMTTPSTDNQAKIGAALKCDPRVLFQYPQAVVV